MGKIRDQITEDMKSAMRKKDKGTISVTRMLLSEMKYAQAENDISKELGDADEMKVVAGYHKRLTKSLDDYPDGDEKEKIKSEIDIVSKYLPKPASEDDIVNLIEKVMAENPEANFGSMMKQVLGKLGPAADGKLVSRLLKAKMS